MRIFLFYTFCFCSLVFSNLSYAQEKTTQIIRGTVLEKETQQPIPGVAVKLMNSNPEIVVPSDLDGVFRITVPIGRQSLQFISLGFEPLVIPQIIVNSAKEVVLTVDLLPSVITTQEVVIVGERPKDKALNEMSTVSTRTFSIEEAQRYAGSVNDPGRMAAGFAGASAPKDNNNDIVVRGTSPIGILWRLEGIDIPNPNHFARKGSTGGGISILSASLLDNGDFSTGAFAAEYGNALSGVFDLKFRKGNNEKREYTARAGLLGLDLAAEGPFNKNKKGGASYLANYRYSTLGILNKLGFRLVADNVENSFQDLCFNISMPTQKAGVFTIFGIAGISDELTFPREDTADFVGPTDYTKTVFNTKVGAIGATHTISLGSKTYLRSVLLYGANRIGIVSDTLDRLRTATAFSNEYYTSGRQSLHLTLNHKISSKHNFKTGLLASNLFYDMNYDKFNRPLGIPVNVLNGKGNAGLLQPYAQIRSRFGSRITLNAGLHALYFMLNKQAALEPRLGLRVQLTERFSMSVGYGIHHQIQPLGNYLTSTDTGSGPYQPNRDLKFTRADHYVFSMDYLPAKNMRVKVEAYYFDLRNIPFGAAPGSTFNILNERDGYAVAKLISEGKQYSKGVDVTLEKFFASNYFFLITASLFDSKYKTLTGNWYNSRYNTNFNFSSLIGKEFVLKNNVIEAGARIVYSNGLRYTPIDVPASIAAYEMVRDDVNAYASQLPAYFRVDLRLAIRLNKLKRASVLGIDIQNATNQKNVYNENYDVVKKEVVYFYQSGLIPVISWKMDF
jgi:hypothetical protein